jgi:hypothetical protein
MNTRQNMTSEPTIGQQLGTINMSERQRREALHDANIGSLFADAVMWVCLKARRQSAAVFVAPSPRY